MTGRRFLFVLFSAFVLAFAVVRCGSSPKKSDEPAWIHEPTRTVDNGYIVYVGKGESVSPENAAFKSEGIALEDLANECSIIPKGARIEDRYSETHEGKTLVYTKLGVEFQVCDAASKAVDPEQIRKLANVPMTEQVRKYQEFEETGKVASQEELAQVEPPDQIAPYQGSGYVANPSPGAPPPVYTGTQFYVARQYISYQKQVVVLAPPAAYPPGSPQSQQFASVMQPQVTQVQNTAAANPTYVKSPTPWSTIPNRPVVQRPPALLPPARRTQMNQRPVESRRAQRYSPRAVAPYHNNGDGGGQRHGSGHRSQRRRCPGGRC